jgi:archaellum biogenesis protein FlaJ (TadC family)
MDFMKEYNAWLKFSKMKFNAATWIPISVVLGVATGAILFFILNFLLQIVTIIPLAFGAAVGIMLLGFPYMQKEKIVDSIERDFSDALKQMADTLKAGDTYASALREIVNSDYGRLSEEMKIALRRLEEGENVETALRGFAERVDSRLIKRTIVIILDSIKTGSSLSDLLEDISDDVRELYRIKEQRKANTTMQFMFMIAAGGFIAPMIFGEVTAVMSMFSSLTFEAITASNQATQQMGVFIELLIQAYVFVAIVGTGLMMSLIREGKLNKSIIYIPLLLLAGYTMYYAATFAVGFLIAGAI